MPTRVKKTGLFCELSEVDFGRRQVCCLRFILSGEPSAASEIGDLDGCAAHCYRGRGKRGHGHPRCGVVDVDGAGLIINHAVDEGVHNESVHTAVAADETALEVFLPYGMLILFEVFLHVADLVCLPFPFIMLVLAVLKDRVGAILIKRASTVDGEVTGIVARKSSIKLESYGLAVGALYDGGDYVTLREDGRLKLLVLGLLACYVIRKSRGE